MEEREKVSLVPGAAQPRRPGMFDLYPDYDPITPPGDRLLAEIGLDTRAVRDALADDRARHCPDREVPAHGSWREAREG